MWVKVDYSTEAKKNPRPNMPGEWAIYTKRHWWNKWVERNTYADIDKYSSSILKHYDACTEARASELGKILTILNTIEKVEVDLKKEIDTYFDNYEIASKEDCYLTHEQACAFAKHFFELGLKTQKGE